MNHHRHDPDIPTGDVYDTTGHDAPAGLRQILQIMAPHVVPVATNIAKYIKDDALVVDVGCGPHPIGGFALKYTKAPDARVIGLDIIHPDEMGKATPALPEDIKRRFLYIRQNIGLLAPDTILNPTETTDPACADKLHKLAAFLQCESPNQAQADVIILSGILPYIPLGEPLDFLFERLKPGGIVIVAGIAMFFIQNNEIHKHPNGRKMADFRRYLEEDDGMEILEHIHCGYVVKKDFLPKLAIECDKETHKRCARTHKDVKTDVRKTIFEFYAKQRGPVRPIKLGTFPVGPKTIVEEITLTNQRRLLTSVFPLVCKDGQHQDELMFCNNEIIVARKPDVAVSVRTGGASLLGPLLGN
ncbi:class I SAM-dependent methyltransferase [Candidatus Peregrinibacteria bacterium]|nr:class I SAM-dependent methyltransferase [Candidatus Peregrinibacteria bacterium]